MKQVVVFFSALIFASFISIPAYAIEHNFEGGTNNTVDNPSAIKNPEESQYVYGYLSKGADVVDYYSFTPNDFNTGVGIALLTVGSISTFQPSLVVSDPSSSRMFGKVPYNFPSNIGGRVLSWAEFHETKVYDGDVFQQLIEGPSIVRDVSPQTYILAVFDPTGIGGRYALRITTSQPEATGVLATVRRLLSALRIKINLY